MDRMERGRGRAAFANSLPKQLEKQKSGSLSSFFMFLTQHLEETAASEVLYEKMSKRCMLPMHAGSSVSSAN